MNLLMYSYAAMLSLVGVLGGIGICSPRKLWLKSAAVATVALILPVAYLSLAELLGRPKPMHLEWQQIELNEGNVVGFDLREGEAIYLWLRIDGVSEPRSYVLDWDQQRAQQLHDAEREAQAQGTQVRLRLSARKGERVAPVFYATPQQALPPKHMPDAFARISLRE